MWCYSPYYVSWVCISGQGFSDRESWRRFGCLFSVCGLPTLLKFHIPFFVNLARSCSFKNATIKQQGVGDYLLLQLDKHEPYAGVNYGAYNSYARDQRSV